MEIVGGEIRANELNEKSFGGTETIARRIYNDVPNELLKEFQIIHSRVRELDETKIRVLVCHDLPQDPESHHLMDGGWSKFHKIIFVSYWQRDAYINEYKIPYSKTLVIHNAIDTFKDEELIRDNEEELLAGEEGHKIKLIYHTTPHRGLELLYPVVNKLAEKYPNIHLDVFSSFKIYGWEQRDEMFKPLYDKIAEHPNMTYHGFQPREEMHKYLKKADIFAYPCVWPETSCLSLIEAMGAKCVCVHPDYAALPETASNWTFSYPFQEDPNKHAGQFYAALDSAIELYQNEAIAAKLDGQKSYIDLFYNWEIRKSVWIGLLNNLLATVTDRKINKPAKMFEYRV